MATTTEVVEFTRTDPSPLLGHLRALTVRGDGDGWVNIGPALDDEEYARVPPRSALGAWFSGRGPMVPMATWTPAVIGDKPRAAQVGVAHGAGPNALGRLAEKGVVLPSDWIKMQDHAKHGIVARLPDDADYPMTVEWLMSAMAQLCSVVPIGRYWIAEVHQSVQS